MNILKTLFTSLTLLLVSSGVSHAKGQSISYVIKDIDTNKIISTAGDTTTQYAPCSSFKIPLCIMGYEVGFIKSPSIPLIKYTKDKLKRLDFYIDKWKQDQTPLSWLRTSCIWYSYEITDQLTDDKFAAFTKQLNYGNMDTSGSKDKNDALQKAWLDTSLQISIAEQIKFFEDFYNNKFTIKTDTFKNVFDTLPTLSLENGWTAHYKTGSGSLSEGRDVRKHGWIVGYLKKDTKTYVFAFHAVDKSFNHPKPASVRLKFKAINMINNIVKNH